MKFTLTGSGWRKKIRWGEPDDIFIAKGNPSAILEEFGRFLKKPGYKVGFISYNLCPERIEHAEDDLGIPDIMFAAFGTHRKESKAKVDVREGGEGLSREDYISAVKRAKEYIKRGDIYQVNISRRVKVQTALTSEEIFHALNVVQPAPFSALLDFGDFAIISGSMELFLRKVGSKIFEAPIKGTRPRGANLREDGKFKMELKMSEKEKAENLMIVDMVRNDLGRIAEIGSVKVEKLFDIKRYKTLWQMESMVSASLVGDISFADIIRATFPPASVTGAPKIRAMDIIEELEGKKRGPYCGAIGIFYPNGDFDLSVAIRIILKVGETLHMWAGSGIVYDSDPLAEYEETCLKLKASFNSIGSKA